MVFVNKKLGNAFVIKEVDSSKDNNHYFGDAKKHVRLQLKPEIYYAARLSTTVSAPYILFYHSGSGRYYGLNSAGDSFTSSDGDTWASMGATSGDPWDALVTRSASIDWLYVARQNSTAATVNRRHVTGSAGFTTVFTLSTGLARAIAVNSAGVLYTAGRSGSALIGSVHSSSDGGTTWTPIDVSVGTATYRSLAIHPTNDNIIYAVGQSLTGTNANWLVRTSSLGGATGSWESVFVSGSTTAALTEEAVDVAIDLSGAVYVIGTSFYNGADNKWVTLKSHVTASTQFDKIDEFSGSVGGSDVHIPEKILFHPTDPDQIWVMGRTEGSAFGFELTAIRHTRNRGKTWYTLFAGKTYSTSRRAITIGPHHKLLFGSNIAGAAIYTLSGTDVLKLSGGLAATTTVSQWEMPLRFFTDTNNVALEDDFLQRNFQITPSASLTIENPQLIFEVSSSDRPVLPRDIFAAFCDRSSNNVWRSYINMTSRGALTEQSDGYWKVTNTFVSGGLPQPVILSGSFFREAHLLFSSSSGTFFVKNIRVEFDKALTDSGVEEYKIIGNDHHSDISSNIKYNVKKVS